MAAVEGKKEGYYTGPAHNPPSSIFIASDGLNQSAVLILPPGMIGNFASPFIPSIFWSKFLTNPSFSL